MERLKLEDIKEYGYIALGAARLCIIDAMNWIDEKIDDALDVWKDDE